MALPVGAGVRDQELELSLVVDDGIFEGDGQVLLEFVLKPFFRPLDVIHVMPGDTLLFLATATVDVFGVFPSKRDTRVADGDGGDLMELGYGSPPYQQASCQQEGPGRNEPLRGEERRRCRSQTFEQGEQRGEPDQNHTDSQNEKPRHGLKGQPPLVDHLDIAINNFYHGVDAS